MESDRTLTLRAKLLRILLIAVCLLLIALIVVFALNSILPGFLDVLEHGDEAAVEDYLRSCGTGRGMLIAFLLQFIQIVSIFFPGGPLQIAIGIVFGTWIGFLICHAGYVAANAAVFLLARRIGPRIVALLVGDPKKSRLSFISDAKHPAFVVCLACLMPFLPNGLVPYIASGTKISFWSFLVAVWVGSIPCLLLLSAIGGKLMTGDYLHAALLCALLAALIVALLLLRKPIFAFSDRISERLQSKKVAKD